MEIYKNLDLKDLDYEIWEVIDGFEDYKISNFGRIKSFKKCRRVNCRILKQRKNNGGYLYIILCKNGKLNHKLIHILVYETFVRKLSLNEIVHHKDEDKLNNDYMNNLIPIDELEHKRLHMKGENNPMFGKKCLEQSEKMKGENNPNVKLTKQNIIQIKIDLKEGLLNQKSIANKCGVSQQTICDIKNNRTWKHIKL